MIKAALPALLMLCGAPVLAATCPAPKGQPCRPTAETKRALVAALEEVSQKKSQITTAQFSLTAALNAGDKPRELLQYEALLKAQAEFADSAARALERIQTEYNVAPENLSGRAHKPTTPSTDLGWIEGIEIAWRPRISLADEEYTQVVVDGHRRHLGYVSNNEAGYTMPSGQVIVRYETIIDALVSVPKNPGLIAEILYHEGKHFDRLATTGWSYRENEEVLAYSAAIAQHEAFELDWDAAMNSKLNLITNTYSVMRMSEITQSPENEAAAKANFELLAARQVRMIEYHDRLKAEVEKLGAEEKKRLEEEAADREREAARRVREAAEAPERAKRMFHAQMDSEAARCGYNIRWDEAHETMLGFNGYTERFPLNVRYRVPFDFGDLQVVFLITRVCGEIESHPQRPAPPACNDAAPFLRERIGRGDFRPKLDYLAAGPNGMYLSYSDCMQELLANADKITDTKSFDKVVSKYQKRLVKRLAKEAKHERRRKEVDEANERARNRREPREDRDPPKDPDHDEVWKRIERL